MNSRMSWRTLGVVVVLVLLGAALLAGVRSESPSPVAVASNSPTPAATTQVPTSPTPITSASPSAQPSALAVPSGPFLIGTALGGVYALQPSGLGERIFDCGKRAVAMLERSPDGRRLLVLCSDSNAKGEGYVWQLGSPAQAIPLALIPYAGAWSPDSRSLALLVPGSCTPTAPVCASHIVRYDIASGNMATLREDDVLVGNLRWTRIGPTYYRSSSPDQGTFVLDGSTWRRIAADRIVAESADGRLLLDRTAYDTSRERHLAVVLVGTTETVLTPADASERGLTFDRVGRVVAMREDAGGGTSIVMYEQTQRIAVTAGDFGPVAVQWNEWLLARTSGNAVAFYSVDARQFASPAVRFPEPVTVVALRPG